MGGEEGRLGTVGAQHQKVFGGRQKKSCSPQLEGWLRPSFLGLII